MQTDDQTVGSLAIDAGIGFRRRPIYLEPADKTHLNSRDKRFFRKKQRFCPFALKACSTNRSPEQRSSKKINKKTVPLNRAPSPTQPDRQSAALRARRHEQTFKARPLERVFFNSPSLFNRFQQAAPNGQPQQLVPRLATRGHFVQPVSPERTSRRNRASCSSKCSICSAVCP